MAVKRAICTMSLGRCFAGHSLAHKLDMARQYGFTGIELFYEDLVDLTRDMPGGDTEANQLSAAASIRKLCANRQLDIICLQPFMHYEASWTGSCTGVGCRRCASGCNWRTRWGRIWFACRAASWPRQS